MRPATATPPRYGGITNGRVEASRSATLDADARQTMEIVRHSRRPRGLLANHAKQRSSGHVAASRSLRAPHSWAQKLVQEALSPFGIEINGPRSWDIRVLNEAFYPRALIAGQEGILDAYVDGWWDTDRLDELVCRVLSSRQDYTPWWRFLLWLHEIPAALVSCQTLARARKASRHYDLGNDLFEAMLDSRMVYTCAYWKDAATLDDAQDAKLDLICRKISLRPGMRVLDIGCGWGSFAKFAAERYGVEVVGITLSREQRELGRELCKGLPIDLRLQDYRDLGDEVFDAVVSVGMFEHVGYKNYRGFMEVVRRSLGPNGVFLLHTIGGNTSEVMGNPWMERNIFPEGMLPSARQIAEAAEGLLVLEDWHNFGPDYDKTLLSWFENFDAAWPRLRAKYGDRFYRLWKCYLLTCAGAFRARHNQLWQIVFSPLGIPDGYVPVR